MGNKINDTTNYPAVTPAATDRVLGIDVSNTTNDANGEVVTFTINSIPLSLLSNDAGFLTSVTTADVTAAGALMDSEVTNLAQVKAFDTTDYATAAQGSTADSALQDVVSDTTPQLGGSLDVNGNKIVSTSNGNIDIEPNGTGNVLLGNFTFNADQTVGAGQDDMVLTYDNAAGTIGLEAAAGGGGGLVPISKVTASADSAIDISLTGGYSAYRLMIRDLIPSSSARDLLIRTSTDSGSTFDSGSANYYYTYFYQAGSSSGAGNTGTSILMVKSIKDSTALDALYGWIDIFPSDGTHGTYFRGSFGYEFSSSYPASSMGTGSRRDATAITDIRLFMSVGNIDSGEFHLYGVADGA